MRATKRPYDLEKLSDELRAASFEHLGLASVDRDDHTDIWVVRPDGSREELPQAAQAIVEAHVLPAPAAATPLDRLARLQQPRVITGSRTTNRDAILAAVLRACEDSGIIIDQTRA